MRVAQTNTRGVVRQGRRAGAYRALPMGAYAVLQRRREVLDVRVKLRRRNRRRRVNRQPAHTAPARSSDESDTKATQPQMPKGAGMPPGNPRQPQATRKCPRHALQPQRPKGCTGVVGVPDALVLPRELVKVVQVEGLRRLALRQRRVLLARLLLALLEECNPDAQ